jgi:hypothetical protein
MTIRSHASGIRPVWGRLLRRLSLHIRNPKTLSYRYLLRAQLTSVTIGGGRFPASRHRVQELRSLTETDPQPGTPAYRLMQILSSTPTQTGLLEKVDYIPIQNLRSDYGPHASLMKDIGYVAGTQTVQSMCSTCEKWHALTIRPQSGVSREHLCQTIREIYSRCCVCGGHVTFDLTGTTSENTAESPKPRGLRRLVNFVGVWNKTSKNW